MKFVLECECGSNDFTYNEEDGFKCRGCGKEYTEEQAGNNLIGDTDW